MISRNEKFLQQLNSVIESHISDKTFGVKSLSQSLQMSEVTLWRKVRKLTSLTPNEYLQKFRLQQAGLMLADDAGSVSEIAAAVGFSNNSYFTKCFREQFGVVPSLCRSRQSTNKKDHKVLAFPDWKIYEDN
ncbi:helix-turn-helix transcriptional regulator [candidate division KSB1 bacterium]|nr:helix-turn-helix transcriptional regulator [candidate division KSB1 bacterium]